MPIFDLPDNFEFSAKQLAHIAGCHRETILNHTEPDKKGSRYFIPSRRNGKKAPVVILAKDAAYYLKVSQRGHLPSNEQ